jgi:pimeloyl-ACP methyl ester carboxylesterase
MKLNRFFLSLVASLFTLFSCGQVAAQAPAAITLVKAGRLLDPRTGNRIRQIQMFLLLAMPISTVAVSGRQVASTGSAPADAVYARPGQLVDAGGFRLNLYCIGSGSPTVVFDSGWGDWAPAWSRVQPEIAKWTRACSYDRAGTGFSDLGPMPRSSVRIAGELRTALHNAGIAGPYILVGSTFGGDNVRTFGEIAGIAFRRDPPRRPAIPAAGVTTDTNVAVRRPRPNHVQTQM